MAKTSSILIDDNWLDLKQLALPNGVTAADVAKVLEVKPVKVSLEVVLPKSTSANRFDYNKNAEVKKFRKSLESKVAATLAEIALEDEPADGKKALDDINSYVEKAVKAFRPILRAAVAKEILPVCKPDDLMTAGSIKFEKYEFLFGVKDETNGSSKMLDLSKALKRVKKKQHLGVAWKGEDIVLSIRARKPFKHAELKELRAHLPKASARTNMLLVGQFIAFSKTKVTVRFLEKTEHIPRKKLFQLAFKQQANSQTVVIVGQFSKEDAEAEEKEQSAQKKPEKSGKKEKGTTTAQAKPKKK